MNNSNENTPTTPTTPSPASRYIPPDSFDASRNEYGGVKAPTPSPTPDLSVQAAMELIKPDGLCVTNYTCAHPGFGGEEQVAAIIRRVVESPLREEIERYRETQDDIMLRIGEDWNDSHRADGSFDFHKSLLDSISTVQQDRDTLRVEKAEGQKAWDYVSTGFAAKDAELAAARAELNKDKSL